MVTTYLTAASRQLAEILVHHGAIRFNNHGMAGMAGMAILINNMTGRVLGLPRTIRMIQGLPE